MGTFLLARARRTYSRQTQELNVATADGERIRAVLVGSRGDPLVTFCPGLFGSCEQYHVAKFVDELASRYDTMTLDFRGHGSSTGASTLGADEVHDLRAVARAASDLGYRRLVAVGTSLGGVVALRCQHKHRSFKGVVTIGTYSEQSKLRRPISRISIRLLFFTPRARPLARAITGTRLGQLRPMTQPLEAAEAVDVPVLVIHGALDPLVEPRHARALAAAVGPTAELVIKPRQGHVTTLLNRATCETIWDWMERHRL